MFCIKLICRGPHCSIYKNYVICPWLFMYEECNLPVLVASEICLYLIIIAYGIDLYIVV